MAVSRKGNLTRQKIKYVFSLRKAAIVMYKLVNRLYRYFVYFNLDHPYTKYKTTFSRKKKNRS